MKFSAILLTTLASLSTSSAFTPSSSNNGRALFTTNVNVATADAAAAAGPSTEPVDKTLKGIDTADDTFDPLGGDSPALIRNNNDEVWVPQVRTDNLELRNH